MTSTRTSPSGPLIALLGSVTLAADLELIDAAEGEMVYVAETRSIWVFEDEEWVNTGGAGRIKRFDTRFGPSVLYQFDGSLADTSGNNLTAAITFGPAARYGDMWPGLRGFYFSGTTLAAPNSALLRARGAMTVMGMSNWIGIRATSSLFDHAQQSAGAQNNILYRVTYNGAVVNSENERTLQWESEDGNPGPTLRTYAPTGVAFSGNGVPVFWAMTRTAAGVVQFYMQGRPWGAAQALPLPTDGESGQLYIGGDSSITGSSQFMGGFQVVVGTALTAGDILDEYNRCFGPAFGLIT